APGVRAEAGEVTRVLAVSSARDVMGTEHSLLNVTPRLSDRGIEMMLAAGRSGTFERRWREMELEFFELDLPERHGFPPNTGQGLHRLSELARLPIRTVRAIAGIVALVRRSGADVVHSNCLITHLDCAIASRVTGA